MTALERLIDEADVTGLNDLVIAARAEQAELVAALRSLMAADIDDRQRPSDEKWEAMAALLSRFPEPIR